MKRWHIRRLAGGLVVLAAAALLPPAAAAQQKKMVIGVSLASSTNPFYIAMEKGMQAKAKELGVELRVVRAEEDQIQQVNNVLDLIQQKVDAILISPISNGAVPAYVKAQEAGIPIFSIARLVDPKYHVAFIGSDWVMQGRRIGEWIAGRLGGKGKVGMLLGPAGASFAMDLEKGVKSVFARHAAIQIVAQAHSPLTRDEGLKHAEDILTAHPDVNAIYGTNDDLALGTARAVKAAGKTGKVLITGFNGIPPAVQAIREGEMHMTTALKPMSWGARGIEAAVDHLKGKKAEKLVEIATFVVDDRNVKALKPADLQ